MYFLSNVKTKKNYEDFHNRNRRICWCLTSPSTCVIADLQEIIFLSSSNIANTYRRKSTRSIRKSKFNELSVKCLISVNKNEKNQKLKTVYATNFQFLHRLSPKLWNPIVNIPFDFADKYCVDYLQDSPTSYLTIWVPSRSQRMRFFDGCWGTAKTKVGEIDLRVFVGSTFPWRTLNHESALGNAAWLSTLHSVLE